MVQVHKEISDLPGFFIKIISRELANLANRNWKYSPRGIQFPKAAGLGCGISAMARTRSTSPHQLRKTSLKQAQNWLLTASGENSRHPWPLQPLQLSLDRYQSM